MKKEAVEIKEKTLSNGLKLIGELNPGNKSCGIGFFVKTGARDEMTEESGVSHFLEHMLFKGTEGRSALDITMEMGNIGAQANAYTSEELTVYYSAIIPEYFSAMQDLLSDMMRPALDADEFDMEKKVILEEIALYQDRPNFFLFENAYQDFFAPHCAGNSVLGTTDSVGALRVEQMQAYFARRYVPDNITLVGSGDFNWNRFIEDAERLCGSWQYGNANRQHSNFKFERRQKIYRKKDLTQAHMLWLAPSCGVAQAERIPLSLLATILGDHHGSKLYWALVDNGLAEGAGADNDERADTGCFAIYAATAPDKLNQVKDVVQKLSAKLLDFSSEDLERAKTKVVTRMALSGELPMGRLMALGSEWSNRSRIHRLHEKIKDIKAITKDDIAKALEKYPLNEWSEFSLLPE